MSLNSLSILYKDFVLALNKSIHKPQVKHPFYLLYALFNSCFPKGGEGELNRPITLHIPYLTHDYYPPLHNCVNTYYSIMQLLNI